MNYADLDPSYPDRADASEASDVPPPSLSGLLAAGRFVVVCEFPRYCWITDALLGTGRHIVSDHATREEANAARPDDDEDQHYVVLPAEKCPDHPSEERATCDMHGIMSA